LYREKEFHDVRDFYDPNRSFDDDLSVWWDLFFEIHCVLDDGE